MWDAVSIFDGRSTSVVFIGSRVRQVGNEMVLRLFQIDNSPLTNGRRVGKQAPTTPTQASTTVQ